MLTRMEFKILSKDNKEINIYLKRHDGLCYVKVTKDRESLMEINGVNVCDMENILKVIRNSPFIFSKQNIN